MIAKMYAIGLAEITILLLLLAVVIYYVWGRRR